MINISKPIIKSFDNFRDFFVKKGMFKLYEDLDDDEINLLGDEGFNVIYYFWGDIDNKKIDAYIEETWDILRYFIIIKVEYKDTTIVEQSEFFVETYMGSKTAEWLYENLHYINKEVQKLKTLKDVTKIRSFIKNLIIFIFRKAKIKKYQII